MTSYFLFLIRGKFTNIKGEFGVSVIINTAIALIITGFILVPGLRTLATNITSDITNWYTNSIKSVLFPGS